MKKTLIALAFAGVFALSAAEIDINWSKAKVGDTKIPGWILDDFGPVRNKVGSGKVIAGSKEGTVAFQITGKDINTAFFLNKGIPAKSGDVVKISAKIKGKGKMLIGYYCYMSDMKFIGGMANTYKSFDATAEFQEVSAELEIKTHPEGLVLGKIRPQITVRPNCDVVIEDLKFEIVNK